MSFTTQLLVVQARRHAPLTAAPCLYEQEGASLRPEAAQVVADMARCSAVYVLAHVSDDIGEATVRGALEAGGLVGAQQGQVPPHRLLFCSTLEGKESIVRQLEPELHIDGHQLTVSLPPLCMLTCVVGKDLISPLILAT